METDFKSSSYPEEKKPLNKANIVMACIMLLMLAAAITFAVLWLTKKTPTESTANNSQSNVVEDCKTDVITKDCPPCTQLDAQPNFMYFSQEKIMNGENGQVYGAYFSDRIAGPDGQDALRVTVSASGSSRATIMADWQTLNDVYVKGQASLSSDSHSYETYELDFSQNIADVFIAGAGQMLGSEKILFLMADGTVEYIPVKEAVAAKEIKSYGKLDGLNNIVKFYRGTVVQADSQAGGGSMSYAQDLSGNIYLLY